MPTNEEHLVRPPGEEYVKEAIWSAKKKRFSAVWIVPIVALLIGALLIFKTLSQKGPSIEISFKSAEGVTAGKSVVKYKDIQVGKVTDVRFSEDLKSVIVTAELNREMKNYLGKETRFWIVNARLTAQSVEGLDTLLSGAYIGMDPKPSSKKVTHFNGLDSPPVILDDLKGELYTLEAEDKGSIQIGSPVYYKKLEAGKVTATRLSEDGHRVLIDIFVNAPFDKLVMDTTRFWDTSGIDAVIGPEGVEIRTASLTAIISGGISFDNFPQFGEGQPAEARHHFVLFKNFKDSQKVSYNKELFFWVHFDGSVRGLKVGAPVEFRGVKVGEVVSFFLLGNAKTADFRIPILIKIEPERFEIKGKDHNQSNQVDAEIFKTLVDKGLRAQLQSANLLTGSLLVELDFHPDAKPVKLIKRNGLYVFPSVPGTIESLKSDAQKILDRIASIPFEEIGGKIDSLLQKLDDQTVPQLNQSMEQLNEELLPSFTKLIENSNTTVEELRKNYLNTDAEIHRNMLKLLDEITRTSRSIKNLTDYLNRHPESLLRGR